ncbi:MAG: ribose 5-phosphate isomerase B [Alphaproteobacteria bacterium]|nr:ribose 5-phosphate isomerase B [Alphaproteobacteria bacterium]
MVKFAIASDHAGFMLKKAIKAHFEGKIEWVDLGTDSLDSVDYPDFADAMGEAITNGDVMRGVLICGSGIGISIAANRFPKVRAALCLNEKMSALARQHNDANVLAFGERLIDVDTAIKCVEIFLNTEFEGGRHSRRVDKLGTEKKRI